VVETEVVDPGECRLPARREGGVGIGGDQRVDDLTIIEIALVILRYLEIAGESELEMSYSG
jgi:hypothetical protein